MSRHLPLLLVLVFCLSFIGLHSQFSRNLLKETPPRVPEQITASAKPDFAAIKQVRKRKKAFFEFIHEQVDVRNQEILALRARIEANEVDDDELMVLAKRYRIKSDDPATIRQRLLIKVDALPPSLVLAQGAMESAWGTSRFAVEGNNYFGQWCFRPGCGLVPESRPEGKKHEVRLFQTPQASVNSYMRNLNSHPAYRDLRAARAQLRAENKRLNGCYLAQGLEHYSEEGFRYVESLKQLIRVNKLEPDPNDHCAAVMLAEEEEPKVDQPQELAVDETQSQATPLPEQSAPPSS